MEKIRYKIHIFAPDNLCRKCSHLHEGECRAYQTPITIEERIKREGNIPLCEQQLKEV